MENCSLIFEIAIKPQAIFSLPEVTASASNALNPKRLQKNTHTKKQQKKNIQAAMTADITRTLVAHFKLNKKQTKSDAKFYAWTTEISHHGGIKRKEN